MADVSELRRRLVAIGVEDQRTVIIAWPNSPLTIALWLATMANGAIVQAIDVDSGAMTIEKAIVRTGPAVVFASHANAAVASEAISRSGTRTRLIVLATGALTGGASIDGLEVLAREPEDPATDAVAALLPTSGTSGAPKLVELTGQNFVFGAERLARNSGYGSSDRHYLCSQYFHTNA